MKKVIQVLLIAVGAALLVFGVVSLFVVNADFGTVLTPIIGLGIVLCGVFYPKIIGSKSRIVKTLRISVVAAFCVCVAAACAIHFYGIHDTTAYDEDALIILGAGIHGDEPSLILKLRLDTGAEYAEKNPEAVIVVSGGRGPQEDITEALAMKNYLIGKGVAADRIVMEDKASSTTENFRFSKALLDNRFGEGNYKTAVITNNFHIFRAVRLAKMNGLEVAHCHAPIPWYWTFSTYIRELAAVIKMFVLKY